MRTLRTVSAVLVLVLAFGSPAFAHYRVNAASGGSGWVGSPPLPEAAQGQGLVYSQGAQANISPSHFGGLVVACEALRANPSVVDIYGPPLLIAGQPSGCPHGQ
jgi:hypothetical protein